MSAAAVRARLAAAGVASPGADARWLIEHVTTTVGDPDEDDRAAAALEALVARRVGREPLQLLIGTWGFRTVELACAPGVFVPRPETEVVAGLAVDAARAAGRRPRVAEPCTGSGAIACALLAEVPGVEVVASDRDPQAVELARANLARLADGCAGVTGPARDARGEVRHGDLLEPLDTAWRGHLDVLVANPPYLPRSDRGRWPPEVAHHDPDQALIGGADGHEVVDRLLALAVEWLAPGGVVVLEIDERRGADALATAGQVGLGSARIVPDLSGADRAITARRPL
ncbi:MAG: N5-glutamine methyltransferase family protein [Nitriliruptoraceae bacterium]